MKVQAIDTEGALTTPTVDDLMAAESRLNHSLAACVVAVMVNIGLTFIVARAGKELGGGLMLAALVVFVVQLACYVWFAVAAGKAARILGEPGWKYVLWILAAPFLSLVPIPIVSTLIGVSPLSIKFLLGGQLDRAIRERPFAD